MGKPNQARTTGDPVEHTEVPAAARHKANLVESEALGGRVQAAAADLTQCEAAFLTLVGEFDAAHASRWWDGIGSTAQWLAWACSIAPVTAREHVRVARALRTLPVIAEAFGRGELSYSKVRTLTRMTGRYKQEKLLQLARAATAAQLARTVSSYRAVSGTHAEREQRTKVSWSNRPDGLVQITAVLLPEDGAAVVAALADATDQNREDTNHTCPGTEIIPAGSVADNAVGSAVDRSDGHAAAESDGAANSADAGDGNAAPDAAGDLSQARLTVARDQAESREDIARRSRVQALVGVFQHWLESRPEDRSGADHTTVVIEVDAVELANTLVARNRDASASADTSRAAIDPTAAPHPTDETNETNLAASASAEALPAGAPVAEPERAADNSDGVPLNAVATAEAPRPTEPARTPTPGASAEARPTPDAARLADSLTAPAGEAAAVVGSSASAEALPALDHARNHLIPEASQTPTAKTETTTTTTTATGTCHVRGHTGIEPDTARRLACEARVHAIIHSLDGEPLAVSRSKRFGTRDQRRALMTRDNHCQFPGCARRRNLKIHHIDHWVDGGTTDLTNLMLLCQFHHTAVHEGHLTISAHTGPVSWRFQRPDGSIIVPEVVGLRYEQALPELGDGFGGILPDGPTRDAVIENRQQIIEQNRQHRQKVRAQQATLIDAYDDIDSGDHPRARRSFPVGGGAGFILGNCVEVLFDCELPDLGTEDTEYTEAGTVDDPDHTLGQAA